MAYRVPRRSRRRAPNTTQPRRDSSGEYLSKYPARCYWCAEQIPFETPIRFVHGSVFHVHCAQAADM